MLRSLGTPAPPQASQAPTDRLAAIACPWLSPVQSVEQDRTQAQPERAKSLGWAIILQEQQEHPGNDLVHPLFLTPWPGKVVLQTLSGTQSKQSVLMEVNLIETTRATNSPTHWPPPWLGPLPHRTFWDQVTHDRRVSTPGRSWETI